MTTSRCGKEEGEEEARRGEKGGSSSGVVSRSPPYIKKKEGVCPRGGLTIEKNGPEIPCVRSSGQKDQSCHHYHQNVVRTTKGRCCLG